MATGEAYLRGPVPALLTAGLAVICIILSLIALLSSSEEFPLEQFSIVTIDTSFLFQDAIGLDGSFVKRGENSMEAIQARQASAVSAASVATGSPGDGEASADALGRARQGGAKTTVDPTTIPAFTPTPSTGADTGDEGNDDTESTLATTGTGTSTGTGTTGSTTQAFPARTFLGDMQLVFNDLLGAAQRNSRIGTGFGNQINDFFGDIMTNFGLQGFYALYMASICDGEFFRTTNQQGQANNQPLIFNTFQCVRYTMLSSNSFSGSNTFNVGGSILDFSNFNIVQRFSDGNNGFVSIFIGIFVLQILGILCLFLILPISLLYIIIRSRLVSMFISALVFLAFSLFLVAAVLVTTTNIFVTALVNSLFTGLGVTATGGGPLLALLWVNLGLVFLALFIWFVKWHRGSYRRRTREREVVGVVGPGSGGARAVGGGKAFPANFFKRRSRATTAGTELNTPIYETFKKRNRDTVEYV